MDTKLTLKLDKMVIERAKKYAKSHDRSLSKLIESYLKSLTNIESNSKNEQIEISSFVKSLSTGVKIPNNIDHKKVYSDHLEEKYK